MEFPIMTTNITIEELQKLETLMKRNIIENFMTDSDTSDSEYIEENDQLNLSESDDSSDTDSNDSSEEKPKKKKKVSKNIKNNQSHNINDIIKIQNLKHSKEALEKKVHFMQIELISKTNELNEFKEKQEYLNKIFNEEQKIISFLLHYKNGFNKNLAKFKSLTDKEHESKNFEDASSLFNVIFKLGIIKDNNFHLGNNIFTQDKFNDEATIFDNMYDQKYDGQYLSRGEYENKIELFKTLYKQIVRRFALFDEEVLNKINEYNFIAHKKSSRKYDFIILFSAVMFVLFAMYLGR